MSGSTSDAATDTSGSDDEATLPNAGTDTAVGRDVIGGGSDGNQTPGLGANGDDDEGYNHPSYCDYDFGSENSCPSSYQGTGDGCDCGCVFPDGTFADPDCHP